MEKFSGLTRVEKTENQTYLGFVMSSKGNNLANIESIKKKSNGVIRKIFNRLNCLNLQKYYFECAMILLNAMLRPSILYVSETYYNLKENEVRQIERIEEMFMRKVLKTSKGCPIVQLYLELGHTPARLAIQKMRILYLQYILQESDISTLNQFLQLQMEMPTKGDWASSVLKDLKDFKISQSFEEIKLMSKNQLTKILRKSQSENALKYLTDKQGTKGKDIEYSRIEMSEYLLPSTSSLTIDEKQEMFSMKNKMLKIPANFPKNKKIQ